MSLRTGVSYAPRGQRKFALSVYVRAIGEGAGSRGGPVDAYYDCLLLREFVDQGMSVEAQRTRLDFMCNVVAVRLGLDYRLRLDHIPKATPKSYYQTRSDKHGF